MAKRERKQYDTRVDFTPMVDMNMLLITFFMFATSLAKPQTMDVVLPTKDVSHLDEKDQTQVEKDYAVTIILGADDKAYYYIGDPNYENYESLTEIDYSPQGLRALLISRNDEVVKEMAQLRIKKARREVTDDQFSEQAVALRKRSKDMVIIKPSPESTYRNLVDVLDEMHICSIGKYAIVEIAEGDDFLVKNYESKGQYGAEETEPAK